MFNFAQPESLSIRLFLCLCIIGAGACRQEVPVKSGAKHQEEPTLFASNPTLRLLDPQVCGIDFQNRIVETYENNITTNINMYNGGGVAIADINNDGLPDVYFVCCNGKNRMYLNKGGLKFEDITDKAGLGSEEGFETAVTAVDINADGWMDFYVCRAGVEKNDARRNKLYVNNGDLTFTERSAEYGLDDKSASTGANFFDYDGDGDLDLYLLNYPAEAIWSNKVEAKLGPDNKYKPLLHPRAEYDTDRLYRNDGGKFTDVSKAAGIWNLAYGLSVSISDFNHDGRPDIYVGNDFIQPDLLYINNGNGAFTDRLEDYFRHTTQHTMGTDLTDFDNDGWIDLYAVDMLSANNYRQKSFLATNTQSKYTALVQHGYFEPVVRNVLQRNNGNGTFSDIGCIAGVYKTDWSWSGLLFDMDNDGLRDLHVTNGYRREVTNRDFTDFILPDIEKKFGTGKQLRDLFPNFQDFLDVIPTYKVRNFCFQNKGDWIFNDQSGVWMTIPAAWSCGAAWADFDGDGDLDLIANNVEQVAFLYENLSAQQGGNSYLQIRFEGMPKNPFAVGASAAIYYGDGLKQYAELYPVRGIFSSVEHLLHFGLGKTQTLERVVVRWPDGKTQEFAQIPANQRLTVRYEEANGGVKPSIAPIEKPENAYFQDISTLLKFVHTENEFNDFEQYPMNPWSVSDLDPLIAVGDVNGDGLDDFFIGNAFDQEPAIYIQLPAGGFRIASPEICKKSKIYEDHGAIFFDADGDGDLDLYVVSGGQEANPKAAQLAWRHRLYINLDGKGAFSDPITGATPPMPDVSLRLSVYDYDMDGDIDLFIGGRVTPNQWPLTPRSLVLRNDRTHFTDVSAQIAPDFERCGMVTDLIWANTDADPAPELIVVGEWMPVSIFKFVGGQLRNVTAERGLAQSNGLWFRVAAGDLDGDGDIDLVTGNLGLNTRFTASETYPLRCFAKDFDNNGTLDPIMAYYENGKLYPLMQKEVLTKHMPILKKSLLYAHDYGLATMDKVWPQKDLDAALNLFCHTLETCWWENQNGKFVKRTLPIQAQTSAQQGILIADFTGDGLPDILLAGNKYGMEVETNRCNAGNGALLAGDGKGGFRWVDNNRSGFWAMNEARDLAMLRGPNGSKIIVVANNNGKAQAYKHQ